MRRLHIQIQPARSPNLDVQAAVARLKELATESRVIEGFDKVAYLNVDLRSPDFPKLLALVQEELTNNVELKEATIVVCEGERGWEDYLLLHHYDPAQPLEVLR